MLSIILQERVTENKDWATIIFIVGFVIIVLNKVFYENQFLDFTRLLFSKKYHSVYKDGSNLYTTFTISMFFIQLIVFTFLFQLFLAHLNYASKTDWIIFIRIYTGFFVFILAKFYIEKIIGTAFNIEEFVESFNFKKASYRAFIGLFLFPVVLVLYYNTDFNPIIFSILFCVIGLLLIYFYILSIINYQNLILSKLFYFILYLCTLEIGPYYFLYHWFIKK